MPESRVGRSYFNSPFDATCRLSYFRPARFCHSGFVFWVSKMRTNFAKLILKRPRLAIGPPVGGALYGHFGYRGPFVFAEACIFLDLIGRLLIIERKEAVIWGLDPAALFQDVKLEQIPPPTATDGNVERRLQSLPMGDHFLELNVIRSESSQPSTSQVTMSPHIQYQAPATPLIRPRSLSLLAVMIKLLKSPRALVALLLTLVYGYCYNHLFPFVGTHCDL